MSKIPLLVVFVLLSAMLAAADGRHRFEKGMTALRANGVYALIREWEIDNDKGDRNAQIEKLTAAVKALGEVVDYELYPLVPLSSRVTRYYAVIHFRKRPLWLRADYYAGDDRNGFFGLLYSEKPDEILPLKTIELPMPSEN